MGNDKDIWSEWLRHRRFGGDELYKKYAIEQLKKLASRIVEKAKIYKSAIVLDIGAGDGLVGLTALSKLGTRGKLILSDVSEAALAIPMEIFNEKKDPRIEFLVTGVENISRLPEGSVDRVLMRSVLLYVDDKQAAFNEISRVLRPGGIVVIMEPINQRHLEFGTGLFKGYRLDREPLLSIQSLLQRVIDELRRGYPASMIGYNEHDLIHFSIKSGFEDIKLEYSLTRTSRTQYISWDVFFDSAANPYAPTLRESLNNTLTREEFNKVESALKKVIKQPFIQTISEALLILKK